MPGEWLCQPPGVLSERVGASQLDLGLEKSPRRRSQVASGEGHQCGRGLDKPVCPCSPGEWLTPHSLAPLPLGWSPGSYREFR